MFCIYTVIAQLNSYNLRLDDTVLIKPFLLNTFEGVAGCFAGGWITGVISTISPEKKFKITKQLLKT